ncbi:MAG: molybdate ABC transporter permease subunit [Phycisphaerae bacterium]
MLQGLWHPLWLSAWVASTATVIGIVVGSVIGLVIARRRFFGRELLDSIILLPMMLPPTVLGYYLLVVIGERTGFGAVWESLLGWPLVFTPTAAVLAACLHTVPIVAKSMRGAFATLDPVLEDMARIDGASRMALARYVYLPQVLPPLVAAGTIAFARAVGDFGVTLMVAGNIPGRTQTASLAIYDLLMAGRDGEALVLTLIVTVICVIVIRLSARAGQSYRSSN